jgi:hypothetical protein
MTCDIFQTVEDLDDAEELKKNGPVYCDDTSAWLGVGYYFWDSEIELAHWWGRVHYRYKSYMILKSSYDNTSGNMFDLYDNAEHRRDFIEAYKVICEKVGKDVCTVPYVLMLLKKSKRYNYKAIRAKFDNSINQGELYTYRPRPITGSHAFLDLYPAIQICVMDKSFMTSPITVVYPKEYIEESYIL